MEPRPMKTMAVTFALWAGVALLMTTVQFGMASSTESSRPFGRELVATSIILWPWLVFGPLTFGLGRRLPVRGPRRWRNLGLHVVAWVVLCGVYPLLYVLPAREAGLGFSLANAYGRWMIISLFWNGLLYLVLHGAGSRWQLRAEVQEQSVRAARAEAQLVQARLAALQAQLHPHFLFNTLNSITALIRTDARDRAIEMVVRLSELLRRVLAASRSTTVPLSEELDLLEDYLELEGERFQDRLRIEYDVDETLRSIPVPTLLLQPLAENAIKHGIAPHATGGEVRVAVRREKDDLVLVVSNTGPEWEPGSLVEGVGLSNTRARLLEGYGGAARLDLARCDGRTEATITLGGAAA